MSAAILTLTSPTAGADTVDDLFIETINQGNISYTSEAKAVEAGHLVCKMLDAAEDEFPSYPGSAIFQGVTSYVAEQTGLSKGDSAYLVGASIGAYCVDNRYMVSQSAQ